MLASLLSRLARLQRGESVLAVSDVLASLLSRLARLQRGESLLAVSDMLDVSSVLSSSPTAW